MEDQRIQTTVEKEQQWLAIMEKKILKSVRPIHRDQPVPMVNLEFEDGTRITLEPRLGVYFEGCLINTLRKAQPVTDVLIEREANTTYVTISAEHFPMLQLIATNKTLPSQQFPFILVCGGEIRG